MYCHACWLFADFKAENYSIEWSDTSAGVYKWKKGMEKIVKHETSHQHQNAIRQYLLTKYRISNDKTVISGLISQECRQVETNREVFKRMIDVTLFLAKQGLSFRGHREHQHCKMGSKGTANNAGNFLELLTLLSKYDLTLDNHLRYEKRNQLHLSHDVQNDLIQSLASEISSTINNKMSVSLRMVLKSGDVVERFIGFYTFKNSNAEAFAELTLSELEKRNIDNKLFRGKAKDGASVMSGIKSGFQTWIKALSPNATYVHCCAHVLNLVTIEAMSVNSDV
ncbi:zinc finger MYM-type protein 1 [Hydra vulgaris]|uniref:zinc finger MYM-type protein 1 n=1 Tax=Hydra vulgaris TaxID=6087 RepID=UPI001F5EBFBD|nr:zinc finger MYM-type protein 1-like [Hydra vulgaris]